MILGIIFNHTDKMGIVNKEVIKTTSGLGLKSAFKILKMGSLFIIFGIVFAKACIESYQAKSFEPLIREIGGKIALATKDLAEQSQLIIDKGDVYIGSIWSVITIYAGLIFAVIAVISWIRIFAWLWGRSPYSFPGNAFENATIGIACFIVLQVVFIIAIGAFEGDIKAWSDIGKAFAIPVISFFLLFKAIIILINPVSSRIESYTNLTA